MPYWLELIVIALVAYSAGLALGWAVWARRDGEEEGHD